MLSDEGYEYCQKLFKRYGPRMILKQHKDKFEMKDEFLETFDTEGAYQWGDDD